ncbi:MAG: pentapeptide repeat-containing protein, partial [Alphaproteobacteria bacterium]
MMHVRAAMIAIGLAAVFAAPPLGVALAFEEIDQIGQKRFKSMKTCAGCLLLQPGKSGKVKMIGANLLGSDLRNLDFGSADLRRANLRGVNLQQVNLAGAQLTGALLRGADLTRANLQGTDLRGADLTGANLAAANLRGANLSQTNFTGANLRGADLRGAAFCQTVMPSGAVKKPECQWWRIEAPPIVESKPTVREAPAKPPPVTAGGSKAAVGAAAAARQTSALTRFFRVAVRPPEISENL